MAQMALAGKIGEQYKIDTNAFIKAFVASLITHDVAVIRPHHMEERRGFSKVIQFLDGKIDELESVGGQKDLLRQLVRITNHLRQSSTGGFEGFEAALRGLQLTFVSCPNPFYEDLAFTVSKPYAQATVMSIPDKEREIIIGAADAFLEEVGA